MQAALCCLFPALSAQLAGAVAQVKLDPARIAEIGAMLPEAPAGVGRTVDDRDAWSVLAANPAWAGVVGRAEGLLGSPLPDWSDEFFLDFSRNGNRTRWQDLEFGRRGRITTLVQAECIEHRGRFLPAIEEVVRSICAEPTWVMAAHDGSLANYRGETTDIDLGSSMLAWEMATAEWLLQDRLSPEMRQSITDNVRRRVVDPFVAMVKGERRMNNWMVTNNNWNHVCLAGVVGAGLATAPERDVRALLVAAAEKYAMFGLKGFTPDGYCSEGVGYWNYGFGHFVLLAETIHQATGGGVDLFSLPEAKMPAAYGARVVIADGMCPAFADCGVDDGPDSRLLRFVCAKYGLAVAGYEDKNTVSPGGGLPSSMIYSFPNSTTSPVPGPDVTIGGLRDWFADAGVLIARGAPLSVALKGGHNAENHNHNDIGSCVVVVKGKPVLVDPGAETYTARTFSSRRYESKLLNSYGHPVPVIAGQLQRPGSAAKATVLESDFTDGADTLKLDYRAAYDVPELQSLERTFVYSREGDGSLTVTDAVTLSTAATVETALITLGTVEQTGADTLVVRDGDAAVEVTIDAGGLAFEITQDEIVEDAPVKPTRVGIRLTEPVTSAVVTVNVVPVAG